MTPCVNDASGISSNSIIFKGGTLENINKLNEINKKIRLNKIMNTQDDNVGYNKDNNEYINDNHQKEDPLDNIIINDNYYKAPSKETDKITTKDSSIN